jgi:hypothetical protein
MFVCVDMEVYSHTATDLPREEERLPMNVELEVIWVSRRVCLCCVCVYVCVARVKLKVSMY